jgi:hypothetical protein
MDLDLDHKYEVRTEKNHLIESYEAETEPYPALLGRGFQDSKKNEFF